MKDKTTQKSINTAVTPASVIIGFTQRNVKLFFKDKGMFFVSLITPLILLVLFVTFLGNVYRRSFVSSLSDGAFVPDSLIEGFVGGWLFSSLLAVCCVTIAFCANLVIIQDKAMGIRDDLSVTGVKSTHLAVSYYIAAFISALTICFIAMIACFVYLAVVGWYLTVADVLLVTLDVIILVMFGTAVSTIINYYLTTQAQMSAVGTIVSSTYGFICGAYMPISQFSEGIRNIITVLPGTYGTTLLRRHLMNPPLNELEKNYIPSEIVEEMRNAFDVNVFFGGEKVSQNVMYLIIGGTTVLAIAACILQNVIGRKKHKK